MAEQRGERTTRDGSTPARRIFDYRTFPGWARFPGLIEPFIEPRPDFWVLDIGGGANPMVSPDLARRITYTLLDIDETELAKAGPVYDRLLCADATMPTSAFTALAGGDAYDLVYSHMFLEHVRAPDAIHRNVFAALKPGGHCIHAFPSATNIPLAVNRALPAAASHGIIRLVQPERDLDGNLGKFPAFYRRCLAPSGRAERYFASFGYEVVRHDGFAGHDYYRRIPVLQALERLIRGMVVAAQLRWICFNVVVLRKPGPPAERNARAAVSRASMSA